MATNPYSFYLDVLSKWETSLSIESLFFTLFHFSQQHIVNNNLNQWTAFWDGNPGGQAGTSDAGWNAENSIVSTLLNTTNQSSVDNLIGCVFAREATLPGDSIDAKNRGLSYGGYQAPVTVNNRTPYSKVSLTFTETNASFVDYVIRPWLVSTGYYGVVARASTVIKCPSLDIIYLGKNGPDSRISKRKIARFYGVIPTSINSLKNSYQSDGMQTYNVDFAYDQYAIIDPNSSSPISQMSSQTGTTASQLGVGSSTVASNSQSPTTPTATGGSNLIFSYLTNPALNFIANESSVTGSPETYLNFTNNNTLKSLDVLPPSLK